MKLKETQYIHKSDAYETTVHGNSYAQALKRAARIIKAVADTHDGVPETITVTHGAFDDEKGESQDFYVHITWVEIASNGVALLSVERNWTL